MKMLWRLLKILVVAGVALWLARNPGFVEIEWRGYVIQTSAAVLALGVVLIALVYSTFNNIVRALKTGMRSVFGTKKETRLEKGLDALTSGLLEMARGDGEAAEKSIKKVSKQLPGSPLTPLLSAQAAQISHQPETAKKHYQEMLLNDATLDLGLRGLLKQALNDNDEETALAILKEGQDRNLKAPWVTETLFELQTRHQKWEEALKTLKDMPVSKDLKARHKAVLLMEKAQKATTLSTKVKLAKQAVDDAPHFAPVVAFAVPLLVEADQKRAAKNMVMKAWQEAPHPLLFDAAFKVAPARPPQRLKFVQKLANIRPAEALSHRLVAEESARQQLWRIAKEEYEKSFELKPLKSTYEAAAKLPNQTIEKRTDFAPEPAWVCRLTGYQSPQWSALTPQGHFDTLEWEETPPAFGRLAQNDLALTAA